MIDTSEMSRMTDADRFHVGGGRIWNKESVPNELKGQDQWLIAKMGENGKPPLYPTDPTAAEHGLSFGDVIKIMEDPDLGFIDTDRIGNNEKVIIGFIIDPDDDYYFVDWDDVRDPSVGDTSIPESIIEWVNEIGGYTEVSPSGTGLKTICRNTSETKSPPPLSEPGRDDLDQQPIGGLTDNPTVDVYTGGQYTSITGNVFGGSDTSTESKGLTDARSTLLDIEDELQRSPATESSETDGTSDKKESTLADIGRKSSRRKEYNQDTTPVTNSGWIEGDWIETTNPTVDQIIATGYALDETFRDLWKGNVSGYKSVSEADIALASKIWYYADDRELVDEVFRQSKLYGIRDRRSNLSDWSRSYPKWDAKSYRGSTIEASRDNNRHQGHYLNPK